MEFKDVLRRVYDACDSVGVTGNEKAIIESATKIYIAGTMDHEERQKEEMRNFFEQYNKHLLDSSESYKDYNIKATILNDIKVNLFAIFKS